MNTTNAKSMILTFGPIYCAAVALLYNGAFWGSFDINILEFADLTDIVSMSITPVISSFIGIFFGSLLGSFFGEHLLKSSKTFFAISVLLTLGSLFFFGIPITALVAITLLQIHMIKSKKSYAELFSASNAQNGIIGFSLLIAIMAYEQGINNANSIIEGKRYKYTILESRELRYIGHTGTSLFLYSGKSKDLVIYRAPEGMPISFQYFPNPPSQRTSLYKKIFGSRDK